MYQPEAKGQGGHLCWRIGKKETYTNLLENVQFFFPVKVRQIPFCGSSKEFENV